MSKKNIIISFVIILVIGLSLIIIGNFKDKNIETMSANVISEAEEISAGYKGIIKEINLEDKAVVKFGDTAAEINLSRESSCTDKSSANKHAEAAYEDAALMYKEGVISKEEYDTSLNTYKQKTQKCKSAENIKPVIIQNDGIFILADGIKTGSTVEPDTVIGKILPAKTEIKAYFSPKYKKKIKTGTNAEIIIIKYPEITLKGTVTAIDSIDIYGLGIIIGIDDDVTDMNINNNDAAIVKIIKK